MRENATNPRTFSTREQRSALLKASFERMQADILAGKAIDAESRQVLLDLIAKNCPEILAGEQR